MDTVNTVQIKKVSMSIFQNGEWYLPSYQFVMDDSGRSASKRPKQDNDCTVRALAKACALDYDVAYEKLQAAGRICNRGFDFKKWAKTNKVYERSFTWKALQAVKGQPRMTLAKFAEEYDDGYYIARLSKHVVAVCNGVVYDTFENRPDRCVYGYWRHNDYEDGYKGD